MAANRRKASSFHSAKKPKLRGETTKGLLNSRGRRTSGKRYLGFCPWRECPEGGPGLPPIDRVEVDEHLTSCKRCSDSVQPESAACVAAEQQQVEGPLCNQCFFNLYIKARKPCILRLLPTAGVSSNSSSCAALADCRALKCWGDLKYLTKVAGEEVIDVEVRDAKKGQVFGAGQYQQMAFGQVIRRLAAGDTSLYVTTQKIASNRDGPKALCGPPLSGDLAADFPVKIPLAGNLVPYQFNVWMGDSREGSSTGLHHDFHDNFYCLIRGRKEFRLFSPRLCELLETHGINSASNDVVLHPNGLISYLKGIREDGAHEASVLRARQKALESKADELRELLEGHKKESCCGTAAGKAGADEVAAAERKRLEDELNETEAELDKCLDAALDAAAADGEEAEDDASLASEDSDLMEGRLVKEGAMPDHFCLAGTRPPSAEASEREPLTKSTVLERFWRVWLEEGDTLYLPAGWFHEVISYSPRSTEDASGAANVHLAFNIWLHPPVWKGTFAKPYLDEFWAEHAAPQIEQQQAASARARAGMASRSFVTKGGEASPTESIHL
ncbi:hypothetical protein Emed_003880 [Eimeria media]